MMHLIQVNSREITMHGPNQKTVDTVLKWTKWGPLAVVIILIVTGLYFRDQLTLNFIVDQVSSHRSISALVLLAIYIVKSLSFVIPVVLLYMSSGIVFTPVEAVGLNILGIWISSTLPYYLGRYYGTTPVDKIYLRYPKVKRLIYLQNQNAFLFAFIIRFVGVIPIELGAVFLGSLSIAYSPYIRGSMLGLLPKMLAYTFLGTMISDPTSPGFIIVLTVDILITVASTVFYHFYLKNQNEKQSTPVDFLF
jgi:uncharacterized membrane protein YdjX (TVP38/TMEM64 family)